MSESSDDDRCPHFNSCVKIDRVMKKVFKVRGKDGSWKCDECDVCSGTGSLWACLTCAHIGCGRYNGGHGQLHFDKSSHEISIELQAGACHCYECDDFVTNDTRHGDMRMFRQMLFEMSCASFSDSVTRSGRQIHPSCEEISTSWNTTSDLDRDEACSGKKRGRELLGEGMAQLVMSGMTESGLCRNPTSASVDVEVPAPEAKKRKRGRPRRDVDVIPGQIGLRNLGNTCFLNSVLQSLSNTPLFRIMVLSLLDEDICGNAALMQIGEGPADFGRPSRRKNHIPEHISVALELKKAFKALWSQGGLAYSPDSFLSVVWKIMPRFYGYHQQDAHEFLRHMLDRLRTELADTKVANFIQDTFQGHLLSEVRCLRCDQTSRKVDPYLDISLVIPTGPDETAVSIQDCLQGFVEPECLEKGDRYKCTNCKNNRQKAMKKFTVADLPIILCLHLKRFRWTPPTRSKVSTPVEFPVELDMSPFCTGRKSKRETTFYLYALITHLGEGTGSGHYTAHCFNNGGWYYYNDTSVRQCSLSDVLHQQAYVLFYIQATAVEPV